MAFYRWPDKDPDETLDYTVDWLNILSTDTISEVDWYIDVSGTKTPVVIGTDYGLVIAAVANTSTTCTAYLGGGINNQIYTLTCNITTTANLTYERSIKIRIRDK